MAADILAAAIHRLEAADIETARLDAEVLLAEAAQVSRVEILTGTLVVSSEALHKFDSMVTRRAAREPVAYIVGHKEFFSLDFEVTHAVLIPRPETEFLVSAALEAIAGKPGARVLDIGTGSGAIAIAIAVNAPGAIVTAADISAEALAIARRNARQHRVDDRMSCALADVYEALDNSEVLGTFDLIVSNPPYVSEKSLAQLAPEILIHEPRVALTDHSDGLQFYRRIAQGARSHMTDDAQLMVEAGAGQDHAIVEIFERAGLAPNGVINDLAGIPRVVIASNRRAFPNTPR
ncbi:MAG TPA: peptide chain release factor N(5)-glutamine methyltransferase [Candidatus Binataceae bacterium]|nr:peptide chain release factor N(5)-glutamine methyltransferase [Candidatus Binataceae bacterium]